MSMWKKLFSEAGAKDVITLFHAPSSPASTRVLTFLKQHNATAVAHATEDQASDHSTQSKTERTDFDLDVQEAEPTGDQVKSILEYVGHQNIGNVVKGASGVEDAIRKVQGSRDAFVRPLTVDWHQGKAVIGDNESEILKLLKSVPKETGSV